MCNDVQLVEIREKFRQKFLGMFADKGQREILEAATRQISYKEAQELIAGVDKLHAMAPEVAAATEVLEKDDWDQFVARHKS